MSDTTTTEQQSELQQQVAELESAKDAVRYCLDHVNGSVGFHGIAYWARRVEDLRKDIQKGL